MIFFNWTKNLKNWYCDFDLENKLNLQRERWMIVRYSKFAENKFCHTKRGIRRRGSSANCIPASGAKALLLLLLWLTGWHYYCSNSLLPCEALMQTGGQYSNISAHCALVSKPRQQMTIHANCMHTQTRALALAALMHVCVCYVICYILLNGAWTRSLQQQ